MPKNMSIYAWIGGIIISLMIFNIGGHFKGIAIYLTNTFPWVPLIAFLLLYPLYRLIKRGAAALGGDTDDVVATAGFFASVLLAIFVTGSLVGNYYQYESPSHFRFTDIFIILTGFVTILYIPTLYLGTPILISILLFYIPQIMGGLYYTFVPHPAAKNAAPAAKGQSQKPIEEKALADTLENQEAPGTQIGMVVQAFKGEKLAKTLRAKAKMNRADADVADAATEYERARRRLKDAEKHAEKVRDHTED